MQSFVSVQIREKTLEFSSAVLPALSPDLPLFIDRLAFVYFNIKRRELQWVYGVALMGGATRGCGGDIVPPPPLLGPGGYRGYNENCPPSFGTREYREVQ